MRKQKININDLYNNGISFFNSMRIKDNDGNLGTRFILDNPLTDTQIDFVNQFKNVVLSSCQHKYAQEIKHSTIILMDKCIK